MTKYLFLGMAMGYILYPLATMGRNYLITLLESKENLPITKERKEMWLHRD